MNDEQNNDPNGELKKKLESELLQSPWVDLKPHAERDAVFLVDPSLVLIDVGVAVVRDDVKSINSWLQSGSLARPTFTQISDWDRDQSREFRFLIVAPYVLIQNLAH